MKTFCVDCGVHFPNEFKNTLKCNFWKSKGLDQISTQRKKQIWDWANSFNFDEFAIKTGFALSVDWKGEKYGGDDFATVSSIYNKMNDKERQEFQKQWFIFLSKAKDLELSILMQYFEQQVWKK